MTEPVVAFLTVRSGKLLIRYSFNRDINLKLKDIGAQFSAQLAAWWMASSPASVGQALLALQGYDVTMDDEVAALAATAEAGRHARANLRGTDGSDLPELPTKTVAWPHQKKGYHFAAPRQGALFNVAMGGGKSLMAVALLDEAWRPPGNGALIICPRSVMNVWPNQFRLHSRHKWDVIVPPTRATVAKRGAALAAGIVRARATGHPWAGVLNYEAFYRVGMKEMLLGLALDGIVLIFDESHRIKAAGGAQSMFAGRLGTQVRANGGRVLLCSGTPLPHGPEDAYAQYRAMDPGIFGTSYSRFRQRYCVMGGYEQRQIIAYQLEDEFAKKFGSAAFTWEKPDPEIPPTHTVINFELESRARKAYNTLDGDFILGIKEGTVTPANALVKLIRLQQLTSGFVRDDDGEDHVVGTEKIDAFTDWLGDLPKTEPLVVFARFTRDIERIVDVCAATGRRVGVVSGQVKEGNEAYGLNDRSQMRDDLDVVVLQLQSGGVGIDLTRAAYCVYFSLDFNLGNYLQSLARVDRPGQLNHVTYVHFVAKDTKDETVYEALDRRLDVISLVIAKADGRGDEWLPKGKAAHRKTNIDPQVDLVLDIIASGDPTEAELQQWEQT